MPESQKGYLGFLDHDVFWFTSKAFVNFFIGYLGWETCAPLQVESIQGNELAIGHVRRHYGSGFVTAKIFVLDHSGP
jgi:hypothetical protein